MKTSGAIAAVLASLTMFAQEPPTVRTTVPLIAFPASVTDKKGHPLYGLGKQDFEVLDNGQPQKTTVDFSDVSSAPVNLVALVQTNDFSTSALGKIRKVGAMVQGAVTGANGSAAVLSYDSQVSVVQDFTRDADKISDAIRSLPQTEESGSRLLDAMLQAMRMLATRQAGERQCILIIGQSRDRGSETKLSAVLNQLQHTGITVYGLTYSAVLTAFTTKASEYQPTANGGYLEGITEAARLGKANTVSSLVNATGGTEVGFATKGKLENDLIGLGRDIHSRYLLSFTPANDATEKFHSVQVRVKSRNDATVHVRPGYWATAIDR